MWITSEVELPDSLIDAYNGGRLVFFVGAGVSMGPPSSLPSFVTLAKQIVETSGRSWLDDDPRGLDGVLGDLESEGVTNVHQRAAAIIGNPDSAPNGLHEAIARLAVRRGPIRIVTTNYDSHLENALGRYSQRGVSTFHAPALPVGDEFEGLVYLHGSLSRATGNLVVTDTDFGRAYLTDAWAARFLERMFRKFVVLFVGYSHADVVMRYLARGLPRESERYSLTDQLSNGEWKRFGIRPIGYSHSGDHAELGEALKQWVALSEMDLLSHESHLASILARSPWTMTRDEESYVQASLDDPVRVALLSKYANHLDWLAWVGLQAQFQSVVQEQQLSSTHLSAEITSWIADTFVVGSEIASAKVFQMVCQERRTLSRQFWISITLRISRVVAPRPAWLNRWIEVLVRDAPSDLVHLLAGLLRNCTWATDRDGAILVLERLVSPMSSLSRPWFDARQQAVSWPTPSIAMAVDQYEIDQVWVELFKPNLDDVAIELLSVFEGAIRRALLMLKLHDGMQASWDTLGFGRTAIEPHSQDSFRDATDALIDGIRDTLENLLRADPGNASTAIDRFERSGILVLERLAIHGWSERSDRNSSEKIEWICGNGLLFRQGAKHEVFRLVSIAGEDASGESRTRLAQLAMEQPMDDRIDAYEVFNFLVWLQGIDPTWESVSANIAAIKRVNPDFEEREFPDLDRSVVEYVPSSLGLEPTDLHRLLSEDVSSGLQRLRAMDSPQHLPGGSYNHEVHGLLSSTVTTFPADAPIVLRKLVGSNEIVDLVLRRAVIRGLETADFEDDLLSAVVAELGLDADLSSCVREVASLLEALTKNATAVSVERLEVLLGLSERLWRLGPDEASDISGGRNDALLRAVNHWAGTLALFHVNAVRVAWLAAGDSWRGIPAVQDRLLRDLVTGPIRKHCFARIIVASQIHLLFGADEAWAAEVVVPLFSWGDGVTAVDVWDAYLFWGRWNDRLLLAGGMLEKTVETFGHLAEFEEEARKRFAARLGDIVVNSGIAVLSSGWIPKWVSSAALEDRVAWTTSVGHSTNSEARAESSWTSWMSRYLVDRASGIPAVMTVEEASAAVSWLKHLDSSFGDAVTVLIGFELKFDRTGHLLYELAHDSVLPDRHPEGVARLLQRVLAGTNEPLQWECASLAKVVERLAPLGADLLRPILNEATRLGCINASTWI